MRLTTVASAGENLLQLVSDVADGRRTSEGCRPPDHLSPELTPATGAFDAEDVLPDVLDHRHRCDDRPDQEHHRTHRRARRGRRLKEQLSHTLGGSGVEAHVPRKALGERMSRRSCKKDQVGKQPEHHDRSSSSAWFMKSRLESPLEDLVAKTAFDAPPGGGGPSTSFGQPGVSLRLAHRTYTPTRAQHLFEPVKALPIRCNWASSRARSFSSSAASAMSRSLDARDDKNRGNRREDDRHEGDALEHDERGNDSSPMASLRTAAVAATMMPAADRRTEGGSLRKRVILRPMKSARATRGMGGLPRRLRKGDSVLPRQNLKLPVD